LGREGHLFFSSKIDFLSDGKGFKRMFACTCFTKVAPLIPYPSISAEPYQGAGILFVEGPVALAGIQKHRQVLKGSVEPRLSGFGGRKEAHDIDWIHTAFRETVEELFGVEDVSVSLLQLLRAKVPYRASFKTGEYWILQSSFEDLKTLLALVAKHIQSPLYSTMPRTLEELITRRCPQSISEIGALALIPVSSPYVDTNFTEDLKKASAS
jgi:hypothetical protein